MKHSEEKGFDSTQDPLVHVHHLCASWNRKAEMKNLLNVDFQVTKVVYSRSMLFCAILCFVFSPQAAPMLAVVGPVGSGKVRMMIHIFHRVMLCMQIQSTLLQCLLRELDVETGTISINGSISYAHQTPWILPDTLRENILVGQAYDEQWYQVVMRACALHEVNVNI